ncbi:MAG: lactonase family protein [Clostridia bacterium]|nr:lactonase family protein [Clostridia bacterium]
MKQLFCIGNYSSKGIPCLNFNKGVFEPFSIFSDNSNSSYLINNKDFLYHIIETSDGMVASYHIKNSLFSSLNHCSTYGKCPCHLTLDTTRKILYIANYEDGSFSAFKINSNGSIGNQLYFEKFEKDVSHIHFISLSQDNNHLFVIDLGTNKIHAYTINTIPYFNLHCCDTFSFPHDTQPRHLVLDLKDRIHVITENSCEIYTLSFKNDTFSFLFKTSLFYNSLQKLEGDTGCAIKINKNHTFLYASLRGQNLICVFEILENKLNLIQSISCYGSMPRDISFDKTEKYLICANQGSDNLSIFSVSPKDGKLLLESTYSIEKPSCILPI